MKKFKSRFLAFVIALALLPIEPGVILMADAREACSNLNEQSDSTEVVVAVIDTGVDYTHKGLADKIKMKGSRVKGYNAITKQEAGFMDDSADSHGTMTAGVIAAEIEKGRGIAGTTCGSMVKIMPVKALDAKGNASIDNVADAIIWAVDNGADIINLSIGEWMPQDSYPAVLSEAVDYSKSKEVLIVAAAGNLGENIIQEKKAYYPACLPEVLSVGSTGPDLKPSKFTNTGAEMYAPGEDIYSTQIGGAYGYDSGTSLAAAHVSGAEAVKLYAMKMASIMENTVAEEVYGIGSMSVQSETPTVTGITVEGQPKLVYTSGEPLDLDDGLKATLHYSDGSSIGPIEYCDFEFMGITADPEDGTVLEAAHNGLRVKLSCEGVEAYTDPLTVTGAPAEGADLSPSTAVFDKNPAHQTDVSVQIQWWNSALSVADVKASGVSVGAANYSVSKDIENKDFLTISKEYLAARPVGELVLTVDFTGGSSAQLTIDIQDTAGITWPVWPEDGLTSTPDRTSTSITVSWPQAQDDVAVEYYRIGVYEVPGEDGDYDNYIFIDTVETAGTTYTFTGLSPDTRYSFWIQAFDGDGEFSSILPHTVNTYAGTAVKTLGLNAPRYTLYGSLYMGDTAEIELFSDETGQQPVVTAVYKEWNTTRDAIENKTISITLSETSSGSGRYTADFPLNEGICEITALEGELQPGITETIPINLKVAGRLKVAVQPPPGLNPEQRDIFNDLLSGSSVLVKSDTGGGSFKSAAANQGVFMIEGMEENDAGYYELIHYDAQALMKKVTLDMPVKYGLETQFQYTLDSFSHVRVRVVDDATGEPARNIPVTSKPLTFIDGSKAVVSAVTGVDGYANVSGIYFAKNILSGSRIELSTVSSVSSSDIAELYQQGTIVVESLELGDKEILIRLKKNEMVTLKGRVTDSNGAPLKDVFVSMPQSFGSGPVINISARTGDNGMYTMQAAKIPGEVSFSGSGTVVKEWVNLTDSVNTLDITMPALAVPTVDVILEEENNDGNIERLDISYGLTVVNKSSGASGLKVSGSSNNQYSISGIPGDIIEAVFNTDNNTSFGYATASATAVLNNNNYAKIRLRLEPFGIVHAKITDLLGNERPGERRRMTIYNAGCDPAQDESIGWVTAFDEYLSCYLPDGNYKAVLSWGFETGLTLSDWESLPGCIITDSFRVETGNAVNLGTIAVNYQAESGYFDYDKGNSFTSSHSTAIPGTVIILKASYNYNPSKPIDPGKLDLAVKIPLGTELADGFAVNQVTRGNISAEPVIGDNEITLDLKEGITQQGGVAGSLIYKVRVSNPLIYDSIAANAVLKFTAEGIPRSQVIGAVKLPAKLITLHAPVEIVKADIERPVKLSGFATANSTVELYDGNIKIGEAAASETGAWNASVSLPDRGTPIYHSITAKTTAGDSEHTSTTVALVGIDKAFLKAFGVWRYFMDSYGQIWAHYETFDPRDGLRVFNRYFNPVEGYFFVYVGFDIDERVEKVKNVILEDYILDFSPYYTGPNNIYNGYASEIKLFEWGYPKGYSGPIRIQYDEEKSENEEILRFDHGVPPDYLVNADAEFVNGTAADIKLEYGADGYIKSFNMPEVKVTAQEESFTVGMKVETVAFDTAKAKNLTDLGDGLYGYDFSYEEGDDGKYMISAYLDRRLLEMPDGFQASRQTTLRAANSKLELAKVVVEAVSDTDKLMGDFGDLSKTAKTAQLMGLLEQVRPNLQPHVADYYESQLRAMGKDALVGKILSLTGDLAGEAANLVPLLGQVVAGVAGLISGKLLDDMFDNEFDSDYNRLMAMLRNEPGGGGGGYQGSGPYAGYDDFINSGDGSSVISEGFAKSIDYGDYWHTWVDLGYLNTCTLLDPSGFVYEAVEDNRIEGVTATALYLPQEKAPDAADADASSEWEVWNAEMYEQRNPQITDIEGRYAWDVPEGWWKVQYVKDGYLTAYSEALPVPPPQLEVNVPMVRLEPPEVEETVWGSGGRYVDIYFSKYMDIRAFEEPNAVKLTDAGGNAVPGTVISQVPPKIGVGGLSLTRTVRFEPETLLTAGGQYTLTVNKAVADYAGFSMTDDYSETGTVPDEALIAELTGADITVEPGKDITQDVSDALTFTAVDPENQDLLDRRLVFSSSDAGVVKIFEDGTIFSQEEGEALITAASLDDRDITASFNVTVALPPKPVKIRNMVILDGYGKVQTDLSIIKGNTYTLNPQISPNNATNKNMTYKSNNTLVATVDQSGKIQAVSEGIATITAKTEDQNIIQKILVTVLPRQQTDDDSRNEDHGAKTAAAPAASDYTVKDETPVAEFKFTDVKESDWFYDAVKFLTEKGIAKGISENEYAPYRTVTRAEFVTMLCRAYGINERSGENFSDAGSKWYTGFLAAVKQLSIAQGVGNNRFEPEREITREEMVVLIYNYFKSKGLITDTESDLTYADKGSISDWAMEAVAYATAKGWVKGKGNNSFDPKGYTTRAELAQVLFAILSTYQSVYK